MWGLADLLAESGLGTQDPGWCLPPLPQAPGSSRRPGWALSFHEQAGVAFSAGAWWVAVWIPQGLECLAPALD